MSEPLVTPPAEFTAAREHIRECPQCSAGLGCADGVDLTRAWLAYEARQMYEGSPTPDPGRHE